MIRHHNYTRREQTLYDKLSSIRELVTNRQTYRSVFYSRRKEKFFQERSLPFTADFHVVAGVDLSGGFSLDTKGGAVRLILPPGKILSVDADDTSLQQNQIKEQLSSVITGDYLPLLAEEKDHIARQARDFGIEKDAEYRAQQILHGMLETAGFERISIAFRREML